MSDILKMNVDLSLSSNFVSIVENHRKRLISGCTDDSTRDLIANCSFGIILSDLLVKFGYLLDSDNIGI